jgi:hypothetical protein
MDPTLGYNCHLTCSSDTARQKKNKRNDVEVKKIPLVGSNFYNDIQVKDSNPELSADVIPRYAFSLLEN